MLQYVSSIMICWFTKHNYVAHLDSIVYRMRDTCLVLNDKGFSCVLDPVYYNHRLDMAHPTVDIPDPYLFQPKTGIWYHKTFPLAHIIFKALNLINRNHYIIPYSEWGKKYPTLFCCNSIYLNVLKDLFWLVSSSEKFTNGNILDMNIIIS